jgi:L,D-peptidoglycan transpeptidase YkuD (ErfK/YbiS/YcfS/YnhG family)
MAFPSIYEMFAPLTTVRKQHFWEYFSGATLNSRWTTTVGGSSIIMNDEADGGLKLYTTSTGTNSNFTMNFNNKRQFDDNASVCIFTVNADVQQASTTNWFLQVGLGHTVGNTGHWLSAKSAQSYLRLQTSQSESSTYSADTTVANSPAWVTAKIENKSSSCELSLNGTLSATKNSGLQTSTGMQPNVYGNRGTSGSAGSNPLVCKLQYFEAYNT